MGGRANRQTRGRYTGRLTPARPPRRTPSRSQKEDRPGINSALREPRSLWVVPEPRGARPRPPSTSRAQARRPTSSESGSAAERLSTRDRLRAAGRVDSVPLTTSRRRGPGRERRRRPDTAPPPRRAASNVSDGGSRQAVLLRDGGLRVIQLTSKTSTSLGTLPLQAKIEEHPSAPTVENNCLKVELLPHAPRFFPCSVDLPDLRSRPTGVVECLHGQPLYDPLLSMRIP